MAAFTAFTPDDIGHVRDYLDQLCTASGPASADLYVANCSTCHGPIGSGGENAFGARGPDIHRYDHCYDPADFYEAVQFGQEAMPPFPGLDADRIAKIIAWVRAPCGG
jgi:mono/diheme cytochrome c family protein